MNDALSVLLPGDPSWLLEAAGERWVGPSPDDIKEQILDALFEETRAGRTKPLREYMSNVPLLRPNSCCTLTDPNGKVRTASTPWILLGFTAEHFLAAQEPLGHEFASVLHDNRWELYEGENTKETAEFWPI